MTDTAYIVALTTFILGCIAGAVLSPLVILSLTAPRPVAPEEYSDTSTPPDAMPDETPLYDEWGNRLFRRVELPAWDDDTGLGYCNELDRH